MGSSEGYLTKELVQEFTKKMIEEEPKAYLFEYHYWNEIQKQYVIACELFDAGEEVSFSKLCDMTVEAGQIAREKTEEEWSRRKEEK
jgi:hypothetical protein